MALELQQRLSGTGPGTWTVVYDPTNISLAIVCSNDFTIVGGTFGDQLMARTSGLPLTTIRPNTKTYYFPYVPVTGLDVAFLCSKNFASHKDIHGPAGAHDTVLPCVISAPYGSVQEFSMPTDVWLPCPSASFHQLHFQLRDRDYKLLSSYVPNVSFLLTID